MIHHTTRSKVTDDWLSHPLSNMGMSVPRDRCLANWAMPHSWNVSRESTKESHRDWNALSPH
ncbi:hypothetical protein MESS2_110102 [Mesorhizobium metallidurans STM 2683]|uniref:Uncharacterized protein n=1 Tax=Mesorhizobium metallidurans STM 2683 TaxID=1297569 RepID=M5EH32_9HYPH|nr:hypothetical protein MESS2_110102 [Mesorhizobium metallidurans STM 2683]